MEPIKTEIKRNEDGTFADGTAPGPGRKPGKTLKEFAREYYACKTDEEKKEYIEDLEKKLPGFVWRMAEGNPESKTDLTSGGKPIPILGNVSANNSNQEDSQATTED